MTPRNKALEDLYLDCVLLRNEGQPLPLELVKRIEEINKLSKTYIKSIEIYQQQDTTLCTAYRIDRIFAAHMESKIENQIFIVSGSLIVGLAITAINLLVDFIR